MMSLILRRKRLSIQLRRIHLTSMQSEERLERWQNSFENLEDESLGDNSVEEYDDLELEILVDLTAKFGIPPLMIPKAKHRSPPYQQWEHL
jgi:hypothetical protein